MGNLAHGRRWRWWAAWALALGGCGKAAQTRAPASWVVCYHPDIDAAALAGYDVVVVDSAWRGDVAHLRQPGVAVLAYLSIGEIHDTRPYAADLRRQGLLLRDNPNWPGAFVVDVRDGRWHDRVVNDLAPALRRRGFDGFFLDTAESPLHLESQDAKRYPGMRAGVVALLARLRRSDPGARIVVNGALELAPALRNEIYEFAVESSLTDWDFGRQQARWRRGDERAWALNRARAARQAQPRLRLYTLDYWDPSDTAGVARIYAEQRAAGFVPYVATIGLDRVVPAPGPARLGPSPVPGLPAAATPAQPAAAGPPRP